MSFQYNSYDNIRDNYENEEEKIHEFLNILKEFTTMEYEAKIAYVKQKYGDFSPPKTIYYGNKCKIHITIDSENKYHFDFSLDEIDIEYLKKTVPELADHILTQVNQQMKNYELKNQVEEKTDSGILDQVIRANENYIKEQFIIKNKK